MTKKLIDIEKLIGDKNPGLLKRLPNFIIRYMKRVLHQEEINGILEENKDLRDAEFCNEIMERFNLKVSVKNYNKAPAEGGVIFVCNHPYGGLDALALVHIFDSLRPDIKFIVNDILLNLESLKGLFVGVNKHGSSAVKSLQQVNELFESDKAVFIFPAGLVSRRNKGLVRDLEWKKTFVTRARKYGKPVVPIFIDGKLSNFFYRFANFRKSLGIKANLEMFYLADELFKLKNKKVNIIVGEPILPEEMSDNRSDKEWTLDIRDRLYSLKEKL